MCTTSGVFNIICFAKETGKNYIDRTFRITVRTHNVKRFTKYVGFDYRRPVDLPDLVFRILNSNRNVTESDAVRQTRKNGNETALDCYSIFARAKSCSFVNRCRLWPKNDVLLFRDIVTMRKIVRRPFYSVWRNATDWFPREIDPQTYFNRSSRLECRIFSEPSDFKPTRPLRIERSGTPTDPKLFFLEISAFRGETEHQIFIFLIFFL